MHSILIIDDDKYVQAIYGEIFKEAGFTVFVARDGVEGLALATQHKPNIIFTGIMMPNLTGFELMKKLKDNETTKNIPVIISSHLGRESDRLQAEELGARAFIVKGHVPPKQVTEIVMHILGEKREIKRYRVAIVPDELDAKEFAADLKMNGNIILELAASSMGLSGEFHAKPIQSGGGDLASEKK
ncbi:MAG: PAS/PAC sensor hybrid histidine kinase [Parcubacteria group bacterium GW2011_GWA2_51_12]|nr:MAG: PAS/PAC sensor hybrid histidine kinase [Parcubacteria group bacterium GW2011_GWA2_51_12]